METEPWNLLTGGHLFEQTLNEAAAMATEIAPAYDLVADAADFTPDDHRKIRDGLLLPMLRNIEKYKAGKSNWQTWHNAGLLWAAPLVGDAEWARKAVADPNNGFVYQMRASVSADGMWHENSFGYHFYALQAVLTTAEGRRRLGIDLWGHPTVKKMFTLPVDFAMPDGTMPRIGDGSGGSIRGAAADLEYAYRAYRDPAMLPYLPARPTWQTVMFGRVPADAATAPPQPPRSRLFDASGYAILRGGGAAGLTAVLTYSPYGGGHAHFDKLSFVLFGHGKELAVDRGSAASQAYRLPIHRAWYKATLSHNTVLVDGQSQQSGRRQAGMFRRRRRTGRGLRPLRRGLSRHRAPPAVVPDALLSAGVRRSDEPTARSASTGCCTTAARPWRATRPPRTTGWTTRSPAAETSSTCARGTTAGPIALRFDAPGVTTHVTVDAAADTAVRTCDGPGGSVMERIRWRSRRAARGRDVCRRARTGGSPTGAQQVTAVRVKRAAGGCASRAAR